MAKTYKVLVNDGKGSDSNAVQVMQGAGDKGAPVRLVAQRGVRYELQDVAKGKGFAPDQVRLKRVSNDLTVMFDGSQKPDLVMEDYYSPNLKGEGNVPMLAGLAENGGVYEYIPHDPNVNHLTPSLKDGGTPVLMALGGGALGEGFVLSALPLVAAAGGGVSGLAVGAGLLGAAALGGGGGGGGATPTPPDTKAPSAVQVALAEADKGVNAAEAADGTTLDAALPTDAVVGDTLTTVVTKPDGTKLSLVHVLTAADIAAKKVTQTIAMDELKDASGNYVDGTWTASTTLTDAAKNVSVATVSSFLLDTTAPTSASGYLKHDAANDTGLQSDDNITNNTKPVLVLTAETGAKVEVLVNDKTYLATETSTKGTYEVQIADALSNTTYAPVVHVTDAAGNTNTSGVCVPFTVDISVTNNVANGTDTDLNNGVTTNVEITAVSEDTGTLTTDFITSARQVKISGVVAQFIDTGMSVGDSVLVQLFDGTAALVGQEYVHPATNDKWAMTVPTASLPDGDYTVKAAIVDAAGNVLKRSADKTLTISQTYFQAVQDSATAQEEGINAMGAAIATVNPSRNVLSNDVDVNLSGRVVTRIQFGTAVAQDVTQHTTSATGLVMDGQYGQLKMGADGSYAYEVDNIKAQSLAATEKGIETFKYFANNASGTSREALLVITVNGANDVAVFDDAASTYLGTWNTDAGQLAGNVVMSDPDNQDEGFTTTSISAYGVFGFTQQSGTGTWTYDLDVSKTAFKNLKKGESATDTLTVASIDGTVSKSVVVNVKGENDAPVLATAVTAVVSSNSNLNDPAPNSLAGATRVLDFVGNVSDVDRDALKGIAITSIHSSGVLWASTDIGVTWTNVASASLSNAVLLNADDTTYVYFQQAGAGSTSSTATFDASAVDKAFTFKAWDQTSGSGVADATATGGSTAFSSNTQDVVVDNTFNISAIPTDLLVKGSTGFDTLKLTTTGLTLDLTVANSHVSLNSIEKIDITGNGNNTIKLNLSSVMQADRANSMHKFYIMGDVGDVVDLTQPDASWVAADHLSTRTVNNLSYNVYQLNLMNELLINSALTDSINIHA